MKKPEWISCTETSTTLRTHAESDDTILEYKEYPEEWTAARTMDISTGASTVIVEGLNPGSTYNFRLAHNDDHGPELIVDTQAPGCTPKPKRCCLIS